MNDQKSGSEPQKDGSEGSEAGLLPVKKEPELKPIRRPRGIIISLMTKILALNSSPRASMMMLIGTCGGSILSIGVGFVLFYLFGMVWAPFSAVVALPASALGAVLALKWGDRNAVLSRADERKLALAERKKRELLAAASILANAEEKERVILEIARDYMHTVEEVFREIKP